MPIDNVINPFSLLFLILMSYFNQSLWRDDMVGLYGIEIINNTVKRLMLRNKE